MSYKCERCVTDKSLCDTCKDNPKYSKLVSRFKEYTPVCPAGYTDCICDPAYIKYHYPKWYENLYGDKTPELAAKINCTDRVTEDGDCDEYDNEDK